MTSAIQSKKIFIVAGGTGGHVFPAQAFGTYLESQGATIQYITDRRGAALPEWPHPPYQIKATYPSKSLGQLFRFVYLTTYGLFQSLKRLKKKEVDAIIGFGGYVCFPVLFVALLKDIPFWLHEQNAIQGKVNKFFSRWCQNMGWAASPQKGAKGQKVGMPLRRKIQAVPPRTLYIPPLDEGYFNLVILGGSQGAKALSSLIPEALSLLPATVRLKLKIHHQVPQRDITTVRHLYHQMGLSPTIAPFFENVAQILSKAHLLISRAGASSMAEILYFKCPTIFVPYPHAVHNHQMLNCQELVRSGSAWMIEECINFKDLLARSIKDLYDNQQTLIHASEKMVIMRQDNPEKMFLDLILPYFKESS